MVILKISPPNLKGEPSRLDCAEKRLRDAERKIAAGEPKRRL